MCVSNFNFLMFALLIIRPEDKAMFSPKRSTKAESKDRQPIEESEILILKAPQKKREPSLLLALCRTFGPYFLISSIYKIVHDVLMFSGPEILRSASRSRSHGVRSMFAFSHSVLFFGTRWENITTSDTAVTIWTGSTQSLLKCAGGYRVTNQSS